MNEATGEILEPTIDPITDPQIKLIQTLLTKLQINTQEDRQKLVSKLLEKEIGHLHDLTKAEGISLIDKLKKIQIDGGN